MIVVGAGIAGLAAAQLLRDSGIATTVLEADRVPGGRLQAVHAVGPGLPLEPALGTVPARTPALDLLCRAVAGELRTERVDRVRIVVGSRVRTVRVRRAGRLGSVPGLLPGDLLRARRVRRLVARFGPHLTPTEPERIGSLDDRSVSEFTALYLGSRLQRRVVGPLLESHFGLDPDDTTRVTLLTLLGPEGGPEVTVVSGLSELACRLADHVGDVRYERRVASVRPGECTVELSSGQKMRADAVVIATPAGEARKLLSGLAPLEEMFLESCSYVGRRVAAVRDPGARGSPPAAPVTWLPRDCSGPLQAILRSRRSDGSGRTLLVARPDAGEEDREDLGAGLLAAGSRLDPDLARADPPTVWEIPRFAARFPVGHYQALTRFRVLWHRQLGQRRVALCGDYLVAPHAEAAAFSGLRAAREIIALLRGEGMPV